MLNSVSPKIEIQVVGSKIHTASVQLVKRGFLSFNYGEILLQLHESRSWETAFSKIRSFSKENFCCYWDSGSNSLVTEKYGGFNTCKKLWVWVWIGQSDAVIKVIWLESVAADHHWLSISKSSQVLSYGFKIYLLKKMYKNCFEFSLLGFN